MEPTHGPEPNPAATPERTPPPGHASAVVLFDGVCNLCNASVRFIIRRDPKARFRFASLDSPAAPTLLASAPRPLPDSIVLIENGRLYTQSAAALRIARGLSWPWPALYALILIPRPLRDALYAFIARRRHRWFGRQESCPLPTPELRDRFIA